MLGSRLSADRGLINGGCFVGGDVGASETLAAFSRGRWAFVKSCRGVGGIGGIDGCSVGALRHRRRHCRGIAAASAGWRRCDVKYGGSTSVAMVEVGGIAGGL